MIKTNTTSYETSFTVYPTDANYATPLIFGGAFFSQMDKAAATLARKVLYDSPSCDAAVTYKFSGTFHKPCYVGDLIYVEAKLTNTGHKSLVIDVTANREDNKGSREMVAEANFVFVSIRDTKETINKPALLPYDNHHLSMP